MNTNTAAMTLLWSAIDLAEMQQGAICANDAPLPIPVSYTIPPLSGNQWAAGTVMTLTFGTLAAQDARALADLHNTSGTLTIYVATSGWRRITGTFSWAPSPTPLLSFTTTSLNILEPWVTPI